MRPLSSQLGNFTQLAVEQALVFKLLSDLRIIFDSAHAYPTGSSWLWIGL